MSEPFERLRALAREVDPSPALLAAIADSLAVVAEEPAALVTTCRRLLAHHPAWGPLWWLCAHVVCSARPTVTARTLGSAVLADRAVERVATALPFPADAPVLVAAPGWCTDALARERPDVAFEPPEGAGGLSPGHLVLLVIARSEERIVVAPGGAALSAALPAVTRVWGLAPVGTLLPDPLVDALLAGAPDHDVLGTGAFDRVVAERLSGPAGATAPVAPELVGPRH